MKRLIYLFPLVFILLSCNKDDVITTQLPPEIVLDNTWGIYTTKVDRPITIAPTYNNAEDAMYVWKVENYDGYIQSVTDSIFTFVASQEGSYYVSVTVTTDYGSDTEEMRIDVVEREIPTISLPAASYDYTLAVGSELSLTPVVRPTSIPTTYCWALNGVPVSDELYYTFSSDEVGEYVLTFKAVNEDGSDEVTLNIVVCTQEEMPMSWQFDQTTYNYPTGQYIRLMPTSVVNGEGAVYTWRVNGDVVQEGEDVVWICTLDTEGTYHVTVTATVVKGTSQISLVQELTVNVCPPQGTFRRAVTATSSAVYNKVYEYTPAPGQFINDTQTAAFDGTQLTAAQAALYADKRLQENNWVSLGGFGGYIVVGFDHSISNSDTYDFAVIGNSFAGSSEPGIVWVMQDANGDGEPNDTWYELRGCATGQATTIQDYAVTYYRPAGAAMPVQWVDNRGNRGEIDYLGQYHAQDYYYPQWIEADSYTLRGTCIESLAYDKSGNGSYWILPEREWGYADNFSAIDCNVKGDKANKFDISNAIDYAGNGVILDYIDFVKVHTGVNAKCGWIGENSTEVAGFYDCSIIE